MKKALIGILLLVCLIAACSPAAQATEEPIADEEPTSRPGSEELTPAERAAVETLSRNLGVPADEITVVSTEAVEWPDACVGIEGREQSCAQVVTPGFQIILKANGKEVAYRTNEDGTVIGPATVAISWKREGGIAGFCDYMTIYLSGEVQASSCKPGRFIEGRLIDVLTDEEMAQLYGWLSTVGDASIDASDPEGVADRMVITLTMMGTGSRQSLSQADGQALLNLMQEVHQRLYK